ncbi:MAG: response regulator [bacterium]
MSNDLSRNYNVLIVDDEPNILKSCERLFQSSNNINVWKSTDGNEALSMAKSINFDLFLLDIMLPVIDGFVICDYLKADPKTNDIPIIFLTGRDEAGLIVKGFEHGAQDYITKPFNAQELLARVKTHLELREKTERLSSMNCILEKKVAERTAQLAEANEKLLNLEKTKSTFLALISHELRTPLTGITILINLIEESMQSDKQKEYMRCLKTSTDSLIKFSETALLITSLKACKNKIVTKPIPVKSLIIIAIGRTQYRADQKNLRLIMEEMSEKPEILVDRELIEQCLENILDNAIRYSPERSGIVLKAIDNKDSVVIEINDSGPGFSEESLRMLFEFFVSDDIAHHTEGLGLGLAAVKLIMDAHFGKIEVENRQEGGASVRLIFGVNKP